MYITYYKTQTQGKRKKRLNKKPGTKIQDWDKNGAHRRCVDISGTNNKAPVKPILNKHAKSKTMLPDDPIKFDPSCAEF